jgi:hypothetical protein
VLDLVRESGAEIQGLTAEEGRLDEFYRELVEEHGTTNAERTRNGHGTNTE